MPYNYNGLMNQLYRQKDNIENMIAQYSQGALNQQAPVQNIINTSNSANDVEIKYLNKDEDLSNIIITKRTMFIDEYNNKISLKELDGTVSKTYTIVVPKDEKDLKIEELEKKLEELEGKINDKSTNVNVTNNGIESTATSATKSTKSTAIKSF